MTTTPITALPPRTFAEQNRKITFLSVPPADLSAITVTELEAGLDATCRVAIDGTDFRPSASEKITDPAVCEPTGAEVPGASKYEATVAPFRFFDEENPGKADTEGDALFSALRVKGTPGTFVIRHVNKKWDEPWAADDEYQAYVVVADNWQPQQDQAQGYIKTSVPLMVTNAELNGTVADGA